MRGSRYGVAIGLCVAVAGALHAAAEVRQIKPPAPIPAEALPAAAAVVPDVAPARSITPANTTTYRMLPERLPPVVLITSPPPATLAPAQGPTGPLPPVNVKVLAPPLGQNAKLDESLETVDDADADAATAKDGHISETKPAPMPPIVKTWTEPEIKDAQARCTAILKRINAVAIPEPAMREGSCGTPAPIQLISIGKSPEVALSPPATVTCEFAEALAGWMKNEVQPLARTHLKADVIRIDVMSSYSCRNAYGRRGNRLSEHGMANALDIRGFVTSGGKTAFVLEDWGTPQREIIARINAEKAKAAAALAAQQAAEKAAQAALIAAKRSNPSAPPLPMPPAAVASTQGAPATGAAPTQIIGSIPRLSVSLPGDSAYDDHPAATSLSLGGSRLGGPTPDEKGAAVMHKEEFLHAVHAAACRVFGTTLGPEANAAHRNHLHVDLAARTSGLRICE